MGIFTESPTRTFGRIKSEQMSKAIEGQATRIPSVFFVGCAIGSMAAAVGLELSGRKQLGNFVGQWVPTFLILGLYNKLVKLEGHGYQGS